MKFDDKFFKDEEREGFFIPEKMKRAWAAQLEVLQEIQKICKEQKIKYFADWGTLLGAVRHGGFIPWDDDLDIGMLREDYTRFLEVAPQLLSEQFELKSLYNDPEHDNVKCRVISGRYMNFDKSYLERFHGCPYVVGVDIFPIDYIPRDKEKSEEQNRMIEIVMKVAASIPEYPPYEEKVWLLIEKVEKMTGICIDHANRLTHELKKIVDILSARYCSEDGDEVTSMIDLAMGWDYHAKKEWYAAAQDMPFEMISIPVPVGYDGILKIKYSEEYMMPVNCGGSHDYPFYAKQEQALKEVIEGQFGCQLSDEEMQTLIEQKIAEALAE